MSNPPPVHRSISKATLASLLGCAEEDLLTRREAAEIIGLRETTLANLAKDGPAYYRSTAGTTAGTSWYPRVEVEAFAAHRRAKIRFTGSGGKRGQQDWTALQPEADRLPVHLVVSIIKEWRESELYRRAQSVLNDPFGTSSRDQFEEERRLFGAAEKGGRLETLGIIADDANAAMQRKAIFESLDDQCDAIDTHLLALVATRGLAISVSHPSFFVLSSMFAEAWSEVLEAETRWRKGDYTGMPDCRPRVLCDVAITVYPKDRPAARAGS